MNGGVASTQSVQVHPPVFYCWKISQSKNKRCRLARRVDKAEVRSDFRPIEQFRIFFCCGQELARESKDASGKFYAFKCDVSDLSACESAFDWIQERFGGVDVLINNAGVYK